MLRITLFGETEVATARGVVPPGGFGGAKPLQILEILALHPGQPVPKERLADLIWEGSPPPSHLATLESYVCVLRKRLGLGGGRTSVLATSHRGYLLDRDRVEVDLDHFRTEVQRARAVVCPTEAVALVGQALDRLRGDLVATEPYAAWAIRERERVQREVLAAVTLGGARALEIGENDTAVRMARLGLEHDGLDEDVWRLLMRALRAAGRTAEALRAYVSLRDRLAVELGCAPSRETTEVYLSILRGGPATHSAVETDRAEEVRVLMRLLDDAMAASDGSRSPAMVGSVA